MKTMKKLMLALMGASLFLAVSCKEGKDTPSPAPIYLSLSQDELSLRVGDSQKLEANQPVRWSSTNGNVSVDSNGLVKALSVGTAYVVAESSQGLKASCLVIVQAREEDSYEVSIYVGEEEAPAVLWSWPGNSLQLQAVSADGKSHSYQWSSTDDTIAVDGTGLVSFGLGSGEAPAGFSCYSEAVIRAVSADGCPSSVKAVSSIGGSFHFGSAMEHVGSNVTMLSGTSLSVSLTWYDGSAFVTIPAEAYRLRSQDPGLVSVEGKQLSSADNAVGSAAIMVEICGREFLLCNVVVEKDGSKSSSGETYIEEPVVW